MAITKTNFIEYTRCRRFPALENIRKDKLESHMTIEEYKKQELSEDVKELVGSMFEMNEEGITIFWKPLPQFGINRIKIYIVSAKTYIMEEQYETYRSD